MFVRTLSIVALGIAFSSPLRAENWPMWRGPRGDGTSLEKNVPTQWSSTQNVALEDRHPRQGTCFSRRLE